MDGFSEDVIYYSSEKISFEKVMKPGLVDHSDNPIVLEAIAGGLGF